MRSSVALALFAIALGSGAHSQKPILRCPAPFARLLSDKIFSAYAVKGPAHGARPAQADVRSGKAHLYRTVIRDAAKRGPDFAGHYTIIRIGCGAATICVAIVDAQTGKIYFPPELKSAEALLVDTGKVDVDTLNYRPDSRLLIVTGSPNENPKRAGASYFLWRSGKLTLVRFTPAFRLCSLPPSTQF